MAIKDKIKTLLTYSGIKPQDLAAPLDVAPATAKNRISGGITSISDLIRIVDYCGAKITITTKDGAVIPLTVDDLPQKDAAK